LKLHILVLLLRSVFSIGSQSIEPLISMDKNFVRVEYQTTYAGY
jgi:hypothetical protein